MDRWIDGWMDGWMDGWKDRYRDMLCEETICCRCIFLTIMVIFMISISIGPDAGVNFLNARTRSNVSSQRVSELLCY